MQETSTLLLILQIGSLAISFTLCLILVMSKLHQSDTNQGYESVRWLLVIAMLIMVIHYCLQIGCGFRAQGDDVGAVINILFYSPVAYILSYAIMRIGCGHGYQRRYILTSLVSFLLIVICFVSGYNQNGSLHMHGTMYIMGLLFFCTMLFFIIYPWKEKRRISRLINEETGQQPVQFNLYMNTGSLLLNAASLFVPIGIFFTNLLVVVGPLFLFSLVFYIISFIALGFNINNVNQIIEGSGFEKTDDQMSDTKAEGTNDDLLSSLQLQLVSEALTIWRNNNGFSATELNSAVLAIRLGIPKSVLIQYLRQVEGKTFRVWLSDLRIEEAKRQMLEHPEYSNEAIASACGFTRNYLQNKFKEVTGLTPSEWRRQKIVAR